ncbi:MAG TPA: phospholipase D family protein [Chthoniobacterales bacterium]
MSLPLPYRRASLLLALLLACATMSGIVAHEIGDLPSGVRSQAVGPFVEIYFSPGGKCTEAIVNEINTAKASIHLQAYSFTSAPIAKALVDAHKRGIKVTAVLDRSNRTQKYSSADFLAHAGIETYIDSRHAIAHNKIIIVDDISVVTGSFNFTQAAEERNAENVLVIRDKKIAETYEQNWQTHFGHSESYPADATR